MEGMSSALKEVMESEEKNKKSYKHQPPDGGWGWVIVIAYAIQNMILLPVLINFGLMFRDVFERLKMTTTDSSIIININSAAGLLFGLMNGPLLKTYGFRKVACVGALLTFFGNSMTSFSTSFYEFIIYYGIISSIGVALVMSSFSLALNTYFVERRGVATGIAMSCTGLGPIFMPLLISKLMTVYGGRGTALIMGGLTLHSFVGAMLLQPVKWHYRKVNEEIELQEKTDNEEKKNSVGIETEGETPSQNSKGFQSKRISMDENTLRGPPEKHGSVHSLNSSHDEIKLHDVTTSDTKIINNIEKSNRPEEETNKKEDKYEVYKTDGKDQHETEVFLKNNGDSQYHERKDKTFYPVEDIPLMRTEDIPHHPELIIRYSTGKSTAKGKKENNTHHENINKRTWKTRIVEFFDLDLLQEPIFRNIWIGMAIAFTAEMNFTLMTPFILGDMGYDTQNTAKIMSIMGTADILTRLTSPFIGQRTKLPARYLYLLSLCILVIFRFGLTVVDSHTAAIFVFIGLGIGKGFRSIYNSLVVPNHVRLEKLPSASGLQTVLNGICLMAFGPILGYMRDRIGNYNSYIHVLNILTLVTITLWVAEFIVRACKQRNK